MVTEIEKIKNTFKEIFRNRLFYLSKFVDYPLLPPEVLQITLTNRCNLDCRMCFVKYYVTKQDEELKTFEVFKLIDDAYNMGVLTIVLSGGEPFLREDIFDICRYCSQKGIRAVVTTNGILLKNKLQQIIDSRVSHLHFSLDGLEDTHDYIRNRKGCFNEIVNIIREITIFRSKTGQGPSTSIACVVMKKNIEDLPGLLKIADDLRVDTYDLLPLIPDNTDFTRFQNENLCGLQIDSPEDIAGLKKAFQKIKTIKTRHTKVNPNLDFSLFLKYYSRVLRPYDWKCFAGFKTIFVTLSDPNMTGKKVPCIFMCKGHIVFDTSKDNLESIWFSDKAIKLRREIKICKNLCFQPCFSIPSLFLFIKSKLRGLGL